MDDDQSEAVDWGDGDDVPDENAESIVVEADAVSLASDDQDDLEALKKYHQNTWDGSREPAISESTVSQSTPAAPPAPESLERNNSSPSNSAPNVHGLPPKPSSNVYSKGPPSNVVSTSATAMAPRNTGPNGNHSSPEVRQSLPPGWEMRTSKAGKDYYYNIEAGTTQWDLPTDHIRPSRSASSRERGKRVDRSRRSRSRSRERRAARRSLSPPRPTYRPRSRSVERDVSHRVARHVSPKRESSRLSRERHAPRVRSRPSSRERRPSPKPSRAVERRSRSPPRARDGRDRQEPHSSSTLLFPRLYVCHGQIGRCREGFTTLALILLSVKAVILMGHLFLSQGTDLLLSPGQREAKKAAIHIDQVTTLQSRHRLWKLTATTRQDMAP